MDLKKIITEERKKQNLSRCELAHKVGCSDMAIYYWETGKKIPSIEMADKILRELGVSMAIGAPRKETP